MNKIIISICLLSVLVLSGCDEIKSIEEEYTTPKGNTIEIELPEDSVTCYIQDNSNHSRFCKYDCGQDMRDALRECMFNGG